MNDKYFIVDLYAHASEHSLVNKAFIQYFESKNSKFLLNNIHRRYLKNKESSFRYPINDSIIKNKTLRLINRELIKISTFILLIPYIVSSKRKVCILGASNIQMYILSMFLFLKPHIIIHGQAEAISNKSPSIPSKLFLKAYKTFCKKNIKLLFLSQHIKNSIPQSNNLFFIKHPIPQDTHLKHTNNIEKIDNIYRIAMVGLIRNDKKNCNLIYDLNLNKNIELWVIGRAHHDFIIKEDSNVKFKLWNSVYNTTEFDNEIKKIDGFLYLFDKSQYKLTASATALDALIYKKTVFTLKNPAIESLLDDYPNVISADNLKELELKINNFTSHNKTQLKNNSETEIFYKYYLNNIKNSDIPTLESWLN